LTSNESEFESALNLMNNESSVHAKVYEVNQKLKYILLEKLKPLNQKEKLVFNKIFKCIISVFHCDIDKFVKESIDNIYKYIKVNIPYENIKGMIQKIKQFFYDLVKQGFWGKAKDIHYRNVGWDNEMNLKILDLGHSF